MTQLLLPTAQDNRMKIRGKAGANLHKTAIFVCRGRVMLSHKVH
ncbi:hypothetical protein [Rheinheimera sp. NSM]